MTVAALHQRMNKRFTRLGRQIDARFRASETRVDARFRASETRIDARLRASEARIDARLKESDARIRAGFESLHDKFNSLSRQIAEQDRHFRKVDDLYETRLQDLERQAPTQADLGAPERQP